LVSDSPSSQYRNKYTIAVVRQICQLRDIASFNWIYSESGHGKGAPDGVGAAVKRRADAHIAEGHSIDSAQDIEMLISDSGASIISKIVSIACYIFNGVDVEK
jgi:hypothetical protein